MLQSEKNMGAHVNAKNPKVKAGFVERDQARLQTDKEARSQVHERAMARSKSLTKLTDMLAGDPFCVKNEPVPKGKELFPAEWRMQFVDLFYPYAVRGPLYIDQPMSDFAIALCRRKLIALKPRGIRYTYVLATESENDARQRLDLGDPEEKEAQG